MSDDTAAGPTVKLPSDGVAGGVIHAGDLQLWIDTMRSIVNETRVHFCDEGWVASVTDPANVAMLHDITLASQTFESYNSPGEVTIGVNLEALDERLGPASADDLVKFNLDMESQKLHLRIRNIVQSVALIDPDAIRQEPDEPELGLPNKLVIEGQDFAEAVDVTDAIGDHMTIEGQPNDRRTIFVGEGDTDSATVGFGDTETIDASVGDSTQSIYSTEYLDAMTDPIPDDTEVSIRFGDELPLRYSYDALDGALSVTGMLAPRVNSD